MSYIAWKRGLPKKFARLSSFIQLKSVLWISSVFWIFRMLAVNSVSDFLYFFLLSDSPFAKSVHAVRFLTVLSTYTVNALQSVIPLAVSATSLLLLQGLWATWGWRASHPLLWLRWPWSRRPQHNLPTWPQKAHLLLAGRSFGWKEHRWVWTVRQLWLCSHYWTPNSRRTPQVEIILFNLFISISVTITSSNST